MANTVPNDAGPPARPPPPYNVEPYVFPAAGSMDGYVALKEHLAVLRAEDREKTAAAFEAAKEKSASHNDLIREMQRKENTFVTIASLRWALAFVVSLVGLMMAAAAYLLK